MKTQILQPNKYNLRLCAEEIRGGGLVAFPTETVYGLGANALDEDAVKKIYIAKGRPSDNPLICHVADVEQIDRIAYVTPSALKIIRAFMPGPVTVVLRKKNVPSVVTGGLDTVGIRMPAHQCALDLIRECGVPICAPSANTSTKPSPTKAEHVLHDLDGKIRYILDGGQCGVGLESTIIDCENNLLLRKGGLEIEKIESVIGKLGFVSDSPVPLCPGMKYKHYSPDAEVILALPSLNMRDIIREFYDKSPQKTVIITRGGDYGDRNVFDVGRSVNEYAHMLFDAFRTLDEQGFERIICEGVPEAELGAALMNRLLKASGGKTI